MILTIGALSRKLFDITPIAMNSLFNSLDDAVFVADSDWQIVDGNPSTKLLFETEILKNNKNIVSWLCDDYRFFEGLNNNEEVAENEIDKLDVLPQTEYSWIETYGWAIKTGVPITFNYRAVLSKYYQVTAYTNELMKFLIIFIDITERTKVEEALRLKWMKWSALRM